jgi:hypothetical protein
LSRRVLEKNLLKIIPCIWAYAWFHCSLFHVACKQWSAAGEGKIKCCLFIQRIHTAPSSGGASVAWSKNDWRYVYRNSAEFVYGYNKTEKASPDRKGLIKIISTRYFLVNKEINKYLVDMILINKKNLSGRAIISREHFRKTHTLIWYLKYQSSNWNLKY